MEDKKREELMRELSSQLRTCLPLIEEERQTFIRAEHGRLQAVMGKEYWDREKEAPAFFHGEPTEDAQLESLVERDPYAISLEELVQLSEMEKRVERLGYLQLSGVFHMYPEDKERLRLLFHLYRRLTHGNVCGLPEIKQLEEGHDFYIRQKTESAVRVIR